MCVVELDRFESGEWGQKFPTVRGITFNHVGSVITFRIGVGNEFFEYVSRCAAEAIFVYILTGTSTINWTVARQQLDVNFTSFHW